MFVLFCQKVEKNYAFEIPDVPSQCEYLEVRYSVSRHGYAPGPIAAYVEHTFICWVNIVFTGGVPCAAF